MFWVGQIQLQSDRKQERREEQFHHLYGEERDLPQVRQNNETSDEDDDPQHWAGCQHKRLL